jgi:hypothetical protein
LNFDTSIADQRASWSTTGYPSTRRDRRALAVDVDPQLRLRRFEARVGVVTPSISFTFASSVVRVLLQLVDVGPCTIIVSRLLPPPPPPGPPTAARPPPAARSTRQKCRCRPTR